VAPSHTHTHRSACALAHTPAQPALARNWRLRYIRCHRAHASQQLAQRALSRIETLTSREVFVPRWKANQADYQADDQADSADNAEATEVARVSHRRSALIGRLDGAGDRAS
jgi:hypothetical protein